MNQRYLYLLDAGHAPATAGKRSPEFPDGTRLFEWEFAREILRHLRRHLEVFGIAHHELTPRVNEDIDVSTRAHLANKIALEVELPCVLVSAHGNAHGDGSEWTDAHGVATLHYPTSAAAKQAAGYFQDAIVEATGWRDRGLKKRSDLAMLRATTMPAVITESGFYTNREQCEDMRKRETRMIIAEAHFKAIAAIERNGL